MKSRIFRGMVISSVLVWVLCTAVIAGYFYSVYSGQSFENMEKDAGIIGQGVENFGEDYLRDLKTDEDLRVTWVSADGEVLYDSGADETKMENHLDRPEIAEAMEKGSGSSERMSDTLSEVTRYYAERLDDGTVIRTAVTEKSVVALTAEIVKTGIYVLIVAVLISVFLANSISKSIVKPLSEIDLENPDVASVYPEVKPLVGRISAQNEILHRQIDELKTDVDRKTREADFRKEFTANVSHELKTPLTSISGFAEIMKNGMVKEDDVPRFAGRIYDEAQRLVTLVGDIIKLSQLDEKKVPAIKERLDLLEICKEQADVLSDAAEKNLVTVRVGGKPVYISGVRQIVGEMVYNLCDNAVKYNVRGGSVNVETFLTNDNRPGFKVSDTGIGIPEEDADRVFERFFRVNKSHSKEIGGTGLGLSIVKHAAAFHDAEIDLSSRPGKGTTVTVIFPAP